MANITDLIQRARTISIETKAKKNTAGRIGGLLLDIVNGLGEAQSLKEAQYGGIVATSTDVVSDYAAKGYSGPYFYLVGSSLSSLVVYQYAGTGTPAQAFGGAAYNFADYSGALRRIDDLGQEIGSRHMTVTYSDITMTKGAVVGSTGANATSDNFYRTPFIDIDGYSKVKFLAHIANASAHTFGWAFYSSNEASSYISGHRVDVDTSLEDYEQKEYTLDIPSGAKYIRTCIYKDFRTSFYLDATAGTPLKDRVGALEE